MYDLHAHILPGIDDGPSTLEDSLEMARVAAQNGTHVILATPHGKDVLENSSVASVREVLSSVSQELQRRGIELTLLLGMENHLELELPEKVSQGHALTMNSSRYVLVELPFTTYPTYTDEVLFQLQCQGLTPVIAHPERNSAIQEDPSIMASLVERGMLGQVTAASLLGAFGREARKSSDTLMRRGLAHIIASDTHNYSGHRSPVLSPGLDAAARLVGEDRARRMVEDTPRALLDNDSLELSPPQALESPRRWWGIWR